MKQLLLVLVICASAQVAASQTTGLLPADTIKTRHGNSAYEQYRSGIFRVGLRRADESVHWRGTGFLVRPCTLATALHMLYDEGHFGEIVMSAQTMVDMRQLDQYTGSTIFTDRERDLALIELEDCPANSRYTFELFPIERPGRTAGERIHVIGHMSPDAAGFEAPIIRSGVVAAAEVLDHERSRLLLIDIPQQSGFEGAPVVLEESGQVIAIVTHHELRLDEKAIGPHFSWAYLMSDEYLYRSIFISY